MEKIQQTPSREGSQLEAPTPTEEKGEARKRNLRDQAKLRKWYPNHCTHHLFHHFVMDRPAIWACTYAKEGDNFCTQGGKKRSHECPDDLEKRDLEAFA